MQRSRSRQEHHSQDGDLPVDGVQEDYWFVERLIEDKAELPALAPELGASLERDDSVVYAIHGPAASR